MAPTPGTNPQKTAKENKKINKGKKDSLLNTQTMLPISEIRGDTLLLTDGGLRAIVKVEGMNIDLKNYDEQVQVVEQYKRFLNGMDFPIQMLVRNTYLDLTDYISYLQSNVDQIENKELKAQGEKFMGFMEDINLQQGLIYVKEFYVVVPYYETDEHKNVKKSRMQKLMGVFSVKQTPEQLVKIRRNFVKNEKFLQTRANLVVEGLKGIGLQAERLDTKGLVEVLFKYYNPTVHENMAELDT